MRFYVARQPIFNSTKEVQAYELLFRSGIEKAFSDVDNEEGSSPNSGRIDGNQATVAVLQNSFIHAGFHNITHGKKAFINFTRDLLLQDFASIFTPETVVVELLETIKPDEETIAACQKLKADGFCLALDDFQYSPEYEPLIELADIIKVDFTISCRAERAQMANDFIPRGIKMLAEKVETLEEFEEAEALGYTFFQGYFFSKPVILTGERMAENKVTALSLIKEVHCKDVNWDEVELVIKRDVSLSYKLLRYINSAFFGLQQEVNSIHQAITLLGIRQMRKWSSFVAMACMSEDMPQELIRLSLVRARFCELFAPRAKLANRDQDMFLLGMFSLLDAMMGQPMEKLLEDIPFSDDVKQALIGERCDIRKILEIAISYEKAQWDVISLICEDIAVDEDAIPLVYFEAMEWAEAVMAETMVSAK